MKTSRILFAGMILSVALGLQSCPTSSPIPLSSQIVGRWKWIKTVTPTRTLTPQTAGYQLEMNYANDGNADYVAFYRNDTLIRKLVERRGSAIVDNKTNTVLLNYGTDGQIKYYLKFNQDNVVHDVETSELMQVYSPQADTIRHHYHYVGGPR